MVEYQLMDSARDVVLLILSILAAVILCVAATAIAVVALAGWLPVNYFLAMWDQIDVDPGYMETSWAGRAFAFRQHADHERTFSQYYLGPVIIDFGAIVGGAFERQWTSVKIGWTLAADLMGGSDSVIGYGAGIGTAVGVSVGAVGGIAVTVVIVLIHAGIAVLCTVAAAISAVVLRGADTVHRYLTGVHMTCPVCAQAVRPYAAYRCPSCNELHRDVRPGRRGIVKRVCVCGSRLPTLLILGASQLTAVCPRCGVSLPSRFGKAAEIVIPLFGSVKAGKTRLIYMLIMAIQELVTANGGTVELVDDTKDEVDRIAAQLSVTGSPSPTVPKSPEAFVLHAKLRLSERYIYLYDVAGELHYRSESLDGLRYLDKANTLIYVVDPLGAEGVWDRLTTSQQDAFNPIRSDLAEAELAYELSRDQIRRLMGKRRLERLAFVVTKIDVLADARVLDPDATIRGLVNDEDWMNMGNIVRDAEHSFGQVGYFKTAAIADATGSVDASVTALASWLLLTEFAGLSLAGE
jgi:Double-GTPase 2